MNHLIAGSPAKSFKRKVQAALMSQASKSYCWGTQDGPRLSMLTGCFNGKMLFELGSTQHRLFQALSMDLYSPRSSGTLFSRTYPGESFNIFSSPAKLRQQIFRLRQKLKSHNIPIIIENNKDLYWLNLVGPITVELETFPQPLVRTELLLKKLASNSNPYLSAQEVCEILGFSRSHFLRLKMGWQNQGNMETKGIGKATRYRFIAS